MSYFADIAATHLDVDTYLTDGCHLYRVVVPWVGREDQQKAELEDCFTLATDLYSPDDLWTMELRLVQPDRALTPA
jgi:hypothetical protein